MSSKTSLAIFAGRYEHGLDEKGRLVLPARFRERLNKRAILAQGLDACLEIYPFEDWAAYIQTHLLPLDPLNSTARALLRRQTASAQEVELDKQGRILIPPHLRETAELTDQVVLVGAWNRIEIWSGKKWREQEETNKEIIKQLDESRPFAGGSFRRGE